MLIKIYDTGFTYKLSAVNVCINCYPFIFVMTYFLFYSPFIKRKLGKLSDASCVVSFFIVNVKGYYWRQLRAIVWLHDFHLWINYVVILYLRLFSFFFYVMLIKLCDIQYKMKMFTIIYPAKFANIL